MAIQQTIQPTESTKTSVDRRALLQMIHAQTRSMLELAQRQDWEGLTALENERREQIRHFFARPVTEEEAVWVSQELAGILGIGEQIAAVVTQCRDQMANEISALNQGARALRAYTLDNP